MMTNPNEIRCRDCHALLGEIRDGALVRPADPHAEMVPVDDLGKLIREGLVMSPVVNGIVACRTCGLRHKVSRRGLFDRVSVTADFRETFTTQRRNAMEASKRQETRKAR